MPDFNFFFNHTFSQTFKFVLSVNDVIVRNEDIRDVFIQTKDEENFKLAYDSYSESTRILLKGSFFKF